MPGTYDLSERCRRAGGWTSATCSDGSNPASVAVDPGEDVTCTFTNLKLDTIIVVKRAVGGDATFPFASQALGNFNLTTVNGEAQQSFTSLAPGAYDLTRERARRLDADGGDPVCSNGDPASAINLAAGQTVVCVFVNLKQDTIVVEKRTIGGDGSFAFTSPQLGGFSLTTTNGAASQSFTGLQPATYSISETVPAGWVQTARPADNGATPGQHQPGAGVDGALHLHQHQAEQHHRGEARPWAATATFGFTGDLGGFTLTTRAGWRSSSFTDLAAGTYAVSETVPAGWDLTSATCSDGSNPASIDLAPGENVTCTFANTKRGSLTVVKNTIGGDGAFAFTSQALGGFVLTTTNGTAQQSLRQPGAGELRPGRDRAGGLAAGRGHLLRRQQPSQRGRGPGRECDLHLREHQAGHHHHRQAGGGRQRHLPLHQPDAGAANFSLTTVNGEAQRIFTNLAPGNYDVRESVPAGWTEQRDLLRRQRRPGQHRPDAPARRWSASSSTSSRTPSSWRSRRWAATAPSASPARSRAAST